MPRGVPDAVTTTDPAASRAACRAAAQAAPEYAVNASPTAWWTLRTPYSPSWAVSPSGSSPTTSASIGTPPPAADSSRANVIASRDISVAPEASVST